MNFGTPTPAQSRGQKFGLFFQVAIELWEDEPARTVIFEQMHLRAKAAVEDDGFQLLEEIHRAINFKKWVPDWIEVRRYFIFWKRTFYSEEGNYLPCEKKDAELVGVYLSWNTNKPYEFYS